MGSGRQDAQVAELHCGRQEEGGSVWQALQKERSYLHTSWRQQCGPLLPEHVKGQKKRGKTKQKGKVKDTQEKDAADMRSSLDEITNMLYAVCVCTEHASECKTAEGREGPEDHDNHCG